MKTSVKNTLALIFLSVMIAACTKESSSSSAEFGSGSNTGIAGSTARFAIVGNTLYTVDNTSLNVFDVSSPTKITKLGSTTLASGGGIETIFPRDSATIFIGSRNGMYIYDIKNPLLLSQKSYVTHFRACDPVVANEKYAFVTLNSETNFNSNCWGSSNLLITYNVQDITNVQEIKRYNLTKPKGLGLVRNNLFICDNMLRWYDATYPENLLSKGNYNIQAHDIITLDSNLILVGENGITQLRFKNDSISFLSKIPTIN